MVNPQDDSWIVRFVDDIADLNTITRFLRGKDLCSLASTCRLLERRCIKDTSLLADLTELERTRMAMATKRRDDDRRSELGSADSEVDSDDSEEYGYNVGSYISVDGEVDYSFGGGYGSY